MPRIKMRLYDRRLQAAEMSGQLIPYNNNNNNKIRCLTFFLEKIKNLMQYINIL